MSDEKNEQVTWVTSLIGLVIALVVGGLAVFSAWKAGKENAKLKHERDLQLEKQKRAEEDARIVMLEADRVEAMDRAAAHMERVEELSAEIEAIEAQRVEALQRIDSITSWDSFRIKRVNETSSTDSSNSDSSSND